MKNMLKESASTICTVNLDDNMGDEKSFQKTILKAMAMCAESTAALEKTVAAAAFAACRAMLHEKRPLRANLLVSTLESDKGNPTAAKWARLVKEKLFVWMGISGASYSRKGFIFENAEPIVKFLKAKKCPNVSFVNWIRAEEVARKEERKAVAAARKAKRDAEKAAENPVEKAAEKSPDETAREMASTFERWLGNQIKTGAISDTEKAENLRRALGQYLNNIIEK